MSDALSRKVWIENFVLSCACEYGSKFAKPTKQKGYRVQLIEVSGRYNLPLIVGTQAYIMRAFYSQFLTRRTPEQPDAAVWALACDGQYYIPVKFATNVVNEFRYVVVSQQTSHRIDLAPLLAIRGVGGKLAVLEDYWGGVFILKGTFTLQYYRIPRKYINNKPSGLEDFNKLYLEVTHVQYVGSMHEPIFVRPRILKRDGLPDIVTQPDAVESVGNLAVVKRWMDSLEKGDGSVRLRIGCVRFN